MSRSVAAGDAGRPEHRPFGPRLALVDAIDSAFLDGLATAGRYDSANAARPIQSTTGAMPTEPSKLKN